MYKRRFGENADKNIKLKDYIVKRFKCWKERHGSYYERQESEPASLGRNQLPGAGY